jgi:lysozyme
MARSVAKKKVTQNRRSSKKTNATSFSKLVFFTMGLLLIVLLVGGIYQYRNGLLYYLGFKARKKTTELTEKQREIEDIRIFEVLSRHDTKLAGFDVSQYQSDIEWEKINTIEDDFPLTFVFIRATAGSFKVDSRFKKNWKAAKEHFFVRGAYHYYRPNENSIVQAENFIKTVHLKKGDLPPVLDIEKLPRRQSVANLKLGLRRWLNKVEKHYKVKPIIYSGQSYYADFLKNEFKGYPLWIANYNFFVERIQDDWHFWQFTEKAQINGIKGMVDVNVFNGNKEALEQLMIQ